jgi:hypothetical protein
VIKAEAGSTYAKEAFVSITAIRPSTVEERDPFLLETVATESLIASVSEDTGPVARTCNCWGSCGPGLCHGTCCSGSTYLEL